MYLVPNLRIVDVHQSIPQFPFQVLPVIDSHVHPFPSKTKLWKRRVNSDGDGNHTFLYYSSTSVPIAVYYCKVEKGRRLSCQLKKIILSVCLWLRNRGNIDLGLPLATAWCCIKWGSACRSLPRRGWRAVADRTMPRSHDRQLRL